MGGRGGFRQRPFQSTRTQLGQHSSLVRGFVFPPIRGNRANKENRPIRQVYNNFRHSLRTNNDDILSNEIPSIDDSFLYQSSEEFESSNSYKKLKSYSNKGYYHLP